MANLIQTVTSAFTPDVTAKLAGAMGESPSAVTGGLGAAVPALLAGAVQRSATPAGAGSLLELVSQATAGGNPLDRLGTLATDESARTSFLSHGQGLASSLLGGSINPVANAVSSHSGIGLGSASNLLALAAPLVLGALGRAVGPSPTAAGLQSLLGGQRASILGALPPGLGSLFGLGAAARPTAQAAEYAARDAVSMGAGGAAAAAARPPGIGRFLPWIVGALVLLGLMFAMRNCSASRAPHPTAPTVSAPTMPAAPSIPMVSLSLPGGGTISVPQGSIGFGLVKFLQSSDPVPKTFIFDNLNYDTASHALTPESQPTVGAMSAILKAYPAVNVRVVGYTDNQGDPAANKTLSEQRANTVKGELVRMGIAADRIEAAGMGESNPIADNATEDGRAKNRRTELVVVKK